MEVMRRQPPEQRAAGRCVPRDGWRLPAVPSPGVGRSPRDPRATAWELRGPPGAREGSAPSPRATPHPFIAGRRSNEADFAQTPPGHAAGGEVPLPGRGGPAAGPGPTSRCFGTPEIGRAVGAWRGSGSELNAIAIIAINKKDSVLW
ncbi:transcription initiation factor TFIID subunit 4-like isoform X1 [Gallus gallus]|uniref:transcription initiation factor TFIID subunit 4-like isoform X1 n=1 Tax=Gallus gallus TaxID=9031 RepID=UPI001F009A72|nr:transcription initiation factor TFIID subunit 4-like isoform X1 [Gallus gallus]